MYRMWLVDFAMYDGLETEWTAHCARAYIPWFVLDFMRFEKNDNGGQRELYIFLAFSFHFEKSDSKILFQTNNEKKNAECAERFQSVWLQRDDL